MVNGKSALDIYTLLTLAVILDKLKQVSPGGGVENYFVLYERAFSPVSVPTCPRSICALYTELQLLIYCIMSTLKPYISVTKHRTDSRLGYLESA